MITTLITIALAWTVLTLFVEIAGPKKDAEFGEKGAALKTLIVYDLDPFYNLDEQVCKSFAKALAATGEYVKVVSVATAKETDASQFNLYVFCPNTYNWLPDWSITRYIKKKININGKNVVAIVLGAGSTGNSQTVFENIIKKKGGVLIGSRTWWLWRPNDPSRMKESNVKVAVELAEKFGEETAKMIANGKR